MFFMCRVPKSVETPDPGSFEHGELGGRLLCARDVAQAGGRHLEGDPGQAMKRNLLVIFNMESRSQQFDGC